MGIVSAEIPVFSDGATGSVELMKQKYYQEPSMSSQHSTGYRIAKATNFTESIVNQNFKLDICITANKFKVSVITW